MSQPIDLRLYTAAQSRGFMVAWLLEEIGEPYETVLIDLAAGEHKSDSYMDIHPLGSVPALVVDGRVMLESLAMCLWLADAFSLKKLAPALDSVERGPYVQWMVYATATLEPALSKPFVRSLGVSPEDRKHVATPDECSAFGRLLVPLETRLTAGFMVGERITSADVVVATELYWASMVGLIREDSSAGRYLSTYRHRPAFQRAEGLTG